MSSFSHGRVCKFEYRVWSYYSFVSSSFAGNFLFMRSLSFLLFPLLWLFFNPCWTIRSDWIYIRVCLLIRTKGMTTKKMNVLYNSFILFRKLPQSLVTANLRGSVKSSRFKFWVYMCVLILVCFIFLESFHECKGAHLLVSLQQLDFGACSKRSAAIAWSFFCVP